MHKLNILSDLDLFFSLHKLPILTRFALLSITRYSLPISMAVLSLIFSEMQILAVFTNTTFISIPVNVLRWLQIFKYIHPLLSIGDLIDYAKSPLIALTIVIIMCIYIFILFFLVIFLLVSMKKEKTIWDFAWGIWGICCNLHLNLLFYPIHFTLLKVFSEAIAGQSFGISQSACTTLQVFSGIALGLNFLFSLVILRYFRVSIKTRNHLSAKTSLLEVFNLAIKTMYPFIFLFYPQDVGVIVFVSINLAFIIMRDLTHFYVLPYYKYSILQLATGMCAASSLFAITGFISSVADLIYGNENAMLSIIMWLLFVPLFVQTYLICLKRLAIKILLHPKTVRNSYHLLHQWYIFKYFSIYANTPAEVSMGYKRNHLIYKARIKQTEIGEDSVDDQNLAKSLVLSSIIENLKSTLDRNARNTLLKINLGAYYIKTKELYVITDRYIRENLDNTGFMSAKNSMYLMRLKIINKLRTNNKAQKMNQIEFIDVQGYITSNESLDILKDKIRAQIKSQLSFWEKFKSHSVQLYSLITLSKQTYKETDEVNRFWNKLQVLSTFGDPEPLLVFALYAYLVLENSILGRNLIMKYSDIKLKEKNDIIYGEAMGQNTIRKNSAWLAISGQPKELGKVLRCSNGISNSLGIMKRAIMGESISIMIPSFFRTKHDSYLQLATQTSKSDGIMGIMQKTRDIYIVNGEGYLLHCYIYVLFSFIPGVGLGYFAILEPTQRGRRVALCREDGTVIECSKNFAEDLNIDEYQKQMDLNIYNFCQELRRIVKAFVRARNSNNFEMPKKKSFYQDTMRSSSMIKGSSEKLVGTKEDNDKSDDDLLSYAYEKFLKDQKLRFIRLFKENGTIMLDRLSGKDILDEIVYNVTLKVHINGSTTMIEIVMDKLDYDDLEMHHPMVHKRTREKSNILPSTAFNSSDKTSSYLISSKKPVSRGSSRAKTGILKNRLSKISSFETEYTMKDQARSRKVSIELSGPRTSLFGSSKKKADLTLNENLFDNVEDTQYTKPNVFSPGREDKPLLLSDNSRDFTGHQGNPYLPTEMKVTQVSESIKIQGQSIQKLIPQSGDDFDVMDPETEYVTKVTINAELDQVLEEISSKSVSLEKDIPAQVKVNNPIPIQKDNNPLPSVSSIATSRNERNKKVISVVLRSRKLGRFSVGYIIIFGLTMLIAMCFMLWFSLNAPNVSKDIKAISTVLQALQLRMFATNLCNQETRLGSAMNTIANDITLYPSTLVQVIGPDATIPNAYKILTKYTMNLENAVALADKDIQDLFYEKNVGVYDRDDNDNLVLFETDNNLQVEDQILSNGFLVASYPYPPAPLPELPRGFRFIFDNSVNDLLVVTENISDILFRRIENTCDNAQKGNIASLGVSLTVLMAFVVGSLHFMMKINNQFFKFTNVLLTLPTMETDKIGDQLAEFDTLLSKEYDENEYLRTLYDIYSGMNPPKERRLKVKDLGSGDNKKVKGNLRQIHPGSIHQVYRANYMLFFQLLLTLLVVVICLIVFYIESQRSIGTLHRKQIQMNTALLNINQQSLISVQLQGMILDNDTTSLRNEPIETSLKLSIDRLNGIADLQKALEESNGGLSEAQTNLFYHYDCSKLSTTLFDHLNPVALNRKCLEITNGRTQVALSTLLPQMASNVEALNIEFQTSNRTEDFLRYLYIKTLSLFLSPIDVSVALFAISYDATALTVETDLASLHKANIVMAAMAVVVSFIVSLLIWSLVVKRMVTKQFDIKQILALVPTKLILDSPHLMRYLMQTSRKEAPELTTISRI